MQKPVKGKTVHQDTDETMVLGVLSAVILVLTVLTVGSYADNQNQLVEQNLLSEKSFTTEQERASYLINTSNSAAKMAHKDSIQM